MSKYTTQLRFICETLSGATMSTGYANVENTIALARPLIFDFSYPFFDEAYKPTLETKFLRHYYTREICCETYGLWKLWLNDELNIIMPYYNELYKSAQLKYDPFIDVNLTTEHSVSTKDSAKSTNVYTSDNSATSNSTNSTKSRFSDTPQGGLAGIENNTYLTNATLNDGEAAATSEGTTDFTGKTTGEATSGRQGFETIKGKRGSESYMSLLKEYRDVIINIDRMVIKDLGDLFMGVY